MAKYLVTCAVNVADTGYVTYEVEAEDEAMAQEQVETDDKRCEVYEQEFDGYFDVSISEVTEVKLIDKW